MDLNYIIYTVWFALLTIEICIGIHLLIVHLKYKSKISVAAVILAIALAFWCGVTAFMCHMDSKFEQRREEYESKLREPGVDEDGNLWIVVETEKDSDVCSAERGDNILKLIDNFENRKNYNVIGIGINYPVHHNWCYQVVDSGECELYRIVRLYGGTAGDKVIKYCVTVNENGDIFQTEERGETPWWIRISPYEEYGIWEIDSIIIEKKEGKKEIEGELFDEFISNLIFMYGSNEVCERPDNIDAMHHVRILYKGADCYRELYIDNLLNVYEVSENGTEREHWKVFHASPYCDMQWLYDWIDMVESEES